MADYSKILGKGWYTKLKPFLESDQFKKIGQAIKKSKDSGQEVIPEFKTAFEAFNMCPYDKLSVVFLSSNSYESGMQGYAFTGKGKHNVYGMVKKAAGMTYEDPEYFPEEWARQGVLLLNTNLTCIKGQPSSHNDIWKPFIDYVMKTLSEYNTGLFYVLVGSEAKKHAKHINPLSNEFLWIEHPMKAFKEGRNWDFKDCFEYINRVGNFLNNKTINW